MDFLHSQIGSAKDNLQSPVHNWYKFTAGFSHRFVEEIIVHEELMKKKNAEIFDPFAGCGTTLVSAQKEGVYAVGNEAQAFMYEIIKAKLNWRINKNDYVDYMDFIKDSMIRKRKGFEFEVVAHPLLTSLYVKDTLENLYSIRTAVDEIKNEKYKLFFRLALSQMLHKVSIHPIAVPYISRKRFLVNDKPVWQVFVRICEKMFNDTIGLSDKEVTSKIYCHDSRKPNRFIERNQCSICITSPPYLNNLDYGEVSKVHTHFFEITKTWNDITDRIRKSLVTGATTHYLESDFDLDEFMASDFAIQHRNIVHELAKTSIKIKKIAKDRSGKKSFDVLMMLYFRDMSLVISEIKRVLSRSGIAYLILGDSAPYGVYVPTTEILGKISQNLGFLDFEIHKIRVRGTKWKSLRYRHSLELPENVLILK